MVDKKQDDAAKAEAFFKGEPKSDIVDEVKDNLKATSTKSATDGVKVGTVEVAGVIVDDQGNSWTIPEKDEVDVHYSSKFFLPKKDPRFEYQFAREEEVTEMMGDQWVPTTRAEVGVAEFKIAGDEYGGALDNYHRVGKMVCMKKPAILVQRTRTAMKRVCDAAVQATEPQPKDAEHEKAREGAKPGFRRYAQDRHTIVVNARNPEKEQNLAQE